jgi:hypothetical protein
MTDCAYETGSESAYTRHLFEEHTDPVGPYSRREQVVWIMRSENIPVREPEPMVPGGMRRVPSDEGDIW